MHLCSFFLYFHTLLLNIKIVYFMKQISCIMLLLMIVAAGQSCKKSTPKSKTELLTQADWKLTSLQSRNSATAPWGNNLLAGASACFLDNLYAFKVDNRFNHNEGVTKCTPLAPQVISSGTWTFLDGETRLAFDGDTTTIEQLDDYTLITQFSGIIGGTPVYSQRTYTH
jgi:hypothetical protein